MARPSKFTQAIADTICERIMNGESLRSIVLDDALPNRSTVHKWLAENKTFSDQYARAKDNQADTLADDIMYIADTAEDVQKARLQVDTRKWVASKLKPKKYGDKVDVTSDGEKIQPVLVRFVGEDDKQDN